MNSRLKFKMSPLLALVIVLTVVLVAAVIVVGASGSKSNPYSPDGCPVVPTVDDIADAEMQYLQAGVESKFPQPEKFRGRERYGPPPGDSRSQTLEEQGFGGWIDMDKSFEANSASSVINFIERCA